MAERLLLCIQSLRVRETHYPLHTRKTLEAKRGMPMRAYFRREGELPYRCRPGNKDAELLLGVIGAVRLFLVDRTQKRALLVTPRVFERSQQFSEL